jgi:hypothetical protein
MPKNMVGQDGQNFRRIRMATDDWKRTPNEDHIAWNKRDGNGLHGIMVYHSEMYLTHGSQTNWRVAEKQWVVKIYTSGSSRDRKYRFHTQEKALSFARRYMSKH